MIRIPLNQIHNEALKSAMGALHELDDADCAVINIEMRGGRVILTADRAPAFVRGVPTVTRTTAGVRTQTRAAPYHGVQLEWCDRVPRAVGGAA